VMTIVLIISSVCLIRLILLQKFSRCVCTVYDGF
jgi:preprotein translocase subunit SecG